MNTQNIESRIKEIKETISKRKTFLHVLKMSRYFHKGERTGTQIWAMAEGRRRHEEIRSLKKELLQLEHELIRNNHK